MSTLSNIERWGDTHRANWLVAFRIALGGFITYKGVYFATHLDQLQRMSQEVVFLSVGAAHYVLFVHLLAGPLILLGYYTRTSCLLQIPVLLGAIIFVNAPKGFMTVGNQSELWVSIITLLILIVFSVMGAGKFSLDEMRRNQEKSKNHLS